jgi:hypothetical protein
MHERELRKGLLQTLIMEMDRSELSKIPKYAQPAEEQAVNMAQANAVEGGSKPDEMKEEMASMASMAPMVEDEEEDEKLSRPARNLKSQMAYAGSMKK